MADSKGPPKEPPWFTKAPAAKPPVPGVKPAGRLTDGPTQFHGPPAKPSKDGGVVLVATPNAYLAVTAGPKKGLEKTVQGEKLILGRDPKCDVVVEDEAASRRHAQIYRKNNAWFLKDLGSTNGTHDLTGLLRASERPLKDRDRFRIGDWEFTFSDPSSARHR